MKLRNLEEAACGRECQHVGWGLCLLAEFEFKIFSYQEMGNNPLDIGETRAATSQDKALGKVL